MSESRFGHCPVCGIRIKLRVADGKIPEHRQHGTKPPSRMTGGCLGGGKPPDNGDSNGLDGTDVTCPICKAEPGKNCKSKDGEVWTEHVHLLRVVLSNRKKEWPDAETTKED